MDVGFGALGEQLQAEPQELTGGTDVRDVLLDNFEDVVLVEHDRAGHDGGGSGFWADENLAGVNIDVGDVDHGQRAVDVAFRHRVARKEEARHNGRTSSIVQMAWSRREYSGLAVGLGKGKPSSR